MTPQNFKAGAPSGFLYSVFVDSAFFAGWGEGVPVLRFSSLAPVSSVVCQSFDKIAEWLKLVHLPA